MKYIFTALPMLMCVEVISWICLLIIGVFIFADLAKAAERRTK